MALDLGKLVRAVRQSDLIVTPQYNRYLLQNPETFPVRDDIAQKLLQLMTTPPRDRSRSFSSSSAGDCHRKQVFGYLGTTAGKDMIIEPQLARIFGNGTWSHMRTQVALWSAGIIDDIEVPLPWASQREKGTADGVGTVPDDHAKHQWRGLEFGLEYKTANSWGFKAAINEGPDRYLDQANRYMLKAGWGLYVILMENKDDQSLHEWVIEPDPVYMDEQREELRLLNESVDTKTLPARLPECEARTGKVFRSCAFGGKDGACIRNNAWPSV